MVTPRVISRNVSPPVIGTGLHQRITSQLLLEGRAYSDHLAGEVSHLYQFFNQVRHGSSCESQEMILCKIETKPKKKRLYLNQQR